MTSSIIIHSEMVELELSISYNVCSYQDLVMYLSLKGNNCQYQCLSNFSVIIIFWANINVNIIYAKSQNLFKLCLTFPSCHFLLLFFNFVAEYVFITCQANFERIFACICIYFFDRL